MISRFKLLFSLLGLVCLGIANAQPSKTNDAQTHAALETQLKSVLHQCPRTMAQAIGFQSLPAVAVNQLFLDCNKEIADAHTDNKKSLDKSLDELQKQSLERDRKSIDWWLAGVASILTVLTILVAVFGIWLQREQKKATKNQAATFNEQVKVLEQQGKAHLNEAERLIQTIQTHEKSAKNSAEKAREAGESIKNITPENDPQLVAANKAKNDENIQIVLKSDDATDADKLRALALKAQNDESNEEALALWSVLLKKLPDDAQAAFRIAFLKAKLLENLSNASADDWQGVATAYEYAQKLDKHQNPSSPNFWIFNNWGNALNKQAGTLAVSDPAGAQVLWQHARKKYGQALSIKPDKYQVASNWGNSLLHEYAFVKNHDSQRANACLAQAKTLLESHADKAQGLCSYNLACLYALEGNAQAAIERLEQAKQFDMLRPAEFIRYDQDFNLIRQHPDFVAWWQKTFPNEAVTLG